MKGNQNPRWAVEGRGTSAVKLAGPPAAGPSGPALGCPGLCSAPAWRDTEDLTRSAGVKVTVLRQRLNRSRLLNKEDVQINVRSVGDTLTHRTVRRHVLPGTKPLVCLFLNISSRTVEQDDVRAPPSLRSVFLNQFINEKLSLRCGPIKPTKNTLAETKPNPTNAKRNQRRHATRALWEMLPLPPPRVPTPDPPSHLPGLGWECSSGCSGAPITAI